MPESSLKTKKIISLSFTLIFIFLFPVMSAKSPFAQQIVEPPSYLEKKQMPLTLTSPAFKDGEEIPARYTYQGQDVSPPLEWTNVPQDTESLVLIIDDPDVPDPKKPERTWIHWVLYNIPPTVAGLPEAVKVLPKGAREGLNDWKRTGYGGPHPPIGRHRYFFKLYAVSIKLDFGKQIPTKADIEEKIFPFTLGKTQLMGTYELKL